MKLTLLKTKDYPDIENQAIFLIATVPEFENITFEVKEVNFTNIFIEETNYIGARFNALLLNLIQGIKRI